MEIGTKIGAFIQTENNIVYFLGWGIYLGDFINPYEYKLNKEQAFKQLGNDCTELEIKTYSILNKQFVNKIPKFQLDNGDIIWACECTWGLEEEINNILKNRKTKTCKIKRDKDGLLEGII